MSDLSLLSGEERTYRQCRLPVVACAKSRDRPVKAAKSLGIEVPISMQMVADEVIE
jgi:hypothetical protein